MSEIDDLRAEVTRLEALNAKMLSVLDEVAVRATKRWLNEVLAVVSEAKDQR